MRSTVIAIIALTIALPATAGSIKKWVDEEGQVHYGDAPPDHARTEEVQIFDNAIEGDRRTNLRSKEEERHRQIEQREAYERRAQEREQVRDDYRALREEQDKRRQCQEFARIETIYGHGRRANNAIRQQRVMGCP
ncbi:MAG: DUF4124 domain-containing protein [Gammaproteobacteria bacterium]|nr:DUF4124 domain-containing protein [Gammaproteobacteria bacterium]